MSIPNFIATPHQPCDELITCNGVGETIDAAISDLESKGWDILVWAENSGHYAGNPIEISVYRGQSPEDAGWEDNPNGFEWCVTDKALVTKFIDYPSKASLE